jgi:hypothetical protein
LLQPVFFFWITLTIRIFLFVICLVILFAQMEVFA